MKYISEYHIFDFFKGKKPEEKERPVEKKKIAPKKIKSSFLFKPFSGSKISVTSRPQKILFYGLYNKSGNSLKKEDLVLNSKPETKFLLHNSEEKYFTLWSSLGGIREYQTIEIDTSEMDNELNSRDLIIGSSVKFDEYGIKSDIYGIINHIYTAIFADFEFSSDIKRGQYGKILKIEDPLNNRVYYRLMNQVELVSNIADLALSEEFEEEIGDYLMDISESKKFDIKITKRIVSIGIINFFIEIKFKDKAVNNLDTIALFFRNINTLKKRINAINEYSIDIEDLSKEGILIKVFKER